MAREQTLAQVVAIERSVKSKVDKEITSGYHLGQKGDPFIGFVKEYRPRDENGDKLPKENKLVQVTATEILRTVSKQMTELFYLTATKDYANCDAKASVVVDSHEIVKDAPVTFLMFLKKYLEHAHTIVSKLPTLSPDYDWKQDPNSHVHRSDTVETVRTQKIKDKIVLLEPTQHHPGRAELIDKDVPVGTWLTTHISGAMPVRLKEKIVEKVEKLQRAVQYAIEEANTIPAPRKDVGSQVLGWLFEGAT